MGHQKVYLSAALYGVELSCCPAAIRRGLNYKSGVHGAHSDTWQQM